MKTIWKALALLGAVVALGSSVLAQAGGGSAKPRAAKATGPLRKLADYLRLTAGQRAQIKPIMQATAQQVRAVRADSALSPADKKAKIRQLREASRQQILAILTPDQKARLAALRHGRKAAAPGA